MKKPGRLQRRIPKNEKHEMEVEIEKVVLIPSARRIAGTEGHQQRTLKRSPSLSKSILNRSPRSDRQHRKPRMTRIVRSRVVYPRTHSTTKSICCEEQQKLVKKSLMIQVEEKQAAEIKNKVQTVKNSLEVANSSIKQTHMTNVNGHRGDEC